jgi:type I restriction enzyme S subunit
MMTETVKPGYKQTEVGVIPEDWEARLLGSLGVFSKGQGIRKAEAASGDIPCIRYGEIYTHHNDVVRIYNSYISQEVAQTSKRIRKGDILFAGSGETKEEIGKAVAFLGDDEVYVGGDIVIFSPQAQSSEFLGYLLNTSIVVRQKASRGQGDAVVHISASALSAVCFPLPPFPEQRAIAAVLSDVDALIAKLDQLIAKKRDLKQAAMQQLLTGQTRLPGFSGEWEVRRLDELADILSGGTPSTSVPQFWNGNIPWCTPTDITALDRRKYLSNTSRMITSHGLKSSSAEMIPAHSIVMTSRATIGECAINTVPVSTNQGFKNFVPFETTDVGFLYYLLTTQKSGFIGLCGGSTFLEIGKAQLATYQVRLPATKVEQTAIATVLSDMDAEIDALEARRAKTRALKQGMMQELLTGRIRLL